ncbi:MAG: hypothetical protein MPJ22_01105 [Pirellulales bacterium]|nr:hypothetical protein [Pirellulales bacterium]
MVDFSKFEDLLRRLGGEKREIALSPPSRADTTGGLITKIIKDGTAEISEENLHLIDIVGEDGLLSMGGQQIVLYILQASCGIMRIRMGEGPRYHLVDCRTLREARAGKKDVLSKSLGQFEKYVAHSRLSEQFSIIPKIGIKKWGDRVNADLRPCRNCLGQLGLPDSVAAAKKFDRVAFFKKYKDKGYFADKPKYNTEDYPSGGYPENWAEVSYKLRAGVNWTCAECGVYCGVPDHQHLLHAHHENGLPADCRRDNLQALCALCHSGKRYHHGMFVKEQDRETILRLRREQEESDSCENSTEED